MPLNVCTRRRPAGLKYASCASSSAVSTNRKIFVHRSRYRPPASVNAILLVLRLRSLTFNCFSSPAIARDMAPVLEPKESTAAVRLPISTVFTNIRIARNLFITTLPVSPHFLPAARRFGSPHLNTKAKPNSHLCTQQTLRADDQTISRLSLQPAAQAQVDDRLIPKHQPNRRSVRAMRCQQRYARRRWSVHFDRAAIQVLQPMDDRRVQGRTRSQTPELIRMPKRPRARW